jgi:hypothetical protein
VGIQQKNTKSCEINFYLLAKIYILLKRKWEREIELACVDEKGRPLEYQNMLKLTKGLLYQIPNILCSLEKDSGSMILAYKR